MLGDYERLGVVVQTASTTVWKGFDPGLKRDVALKHLTGAGADAARREAAVLARLSHPNIVSVYDVFDDDGVWLVEQWISGAPLSAVLAHTGKLRAIDALALIHGALTGLAHAHSRALVHGDVSPANVLIDQSGTPMLVDFGLAVTPGQTSRGGTPGYMAPEALAGEPIDKRSDVYSACVVLAELLKGRKLFAHASELASSQQTAAAPELDGIEAPVVQVLSAGLDRRPDVRPSDAAALLEMLEAAAEKTHGKGWLALAGLGTVGSTAATVGAGVTLTSTVAAAAGGTAAATVASTATTVASAAGRGKLYAAAGVGAAAVAAIASFLLVRPDTSQTTASTATTTTTTTTSSIIAAPPPLPPPPPDGPILRGTYTLVGQFRAATATRQVTFASDCARCDARMTVEGRSGTLTWEGTGWGATSSGQCGMHSVVVPGVLVDGIVQNFTMENTWVIPGGCGVPDAPTDVGTRVGD